MSCLLIISYFFIVVIAYRILFCSYLYFILFFIGPKAQARFGPKAHFCCFIFEPKQANTKQPKQTGKPNSTWPNRWLVSPNEGPPRARPPFCMSHFLSHPPRFQPLRLHARICTSKTKQQSTCLASSPLVSLPSCERPQTVTNLPGQLLHLAVALRLRASSLCKLDTWTAVGFSLPTYKRRLVPLHQAGCPLATSFPVAPQPAKAYDMTWCPFFQAVSQACFSSSR